MRRVAVVCLCVATAPAIAPLALAVTLNQLGNSSRSVTTGLFGYAEFNAPTLKALPQWNRVLGRMSTLGREFERCVSDDSQCDDPTKRAWRRAIKTAMGLPKSQLLDYINRFFNGWPYRNDYDLYGVREYWATPDEFMQRSGDCEDYSIAKFYALRELGFANDDLRIVVVRDSIRGLGHAVLAVRIDGEMQILDSLSNAILPHTKYRHYIPQYSVNETMRWLHAAPATAPPAIN